MHFKYLSIATVVPITSARIYLPGEEKPDFGDGPALMMLPIGGEDANQGEGEDSLPSVSNFSLNPADSNPETQPEASNLILSQDDQRESNTVEGLDFDVQQISNTTSDIPWWMKDESAGEGEIAVDSTEDGAQQQPTTYSSDIIGPTWECTEYLNADQDALVDLVNGTTITIEFESDGRFDGRSGCNLYGGTAEHGESSFDVAGPLWGTLVMCDEDVSNQEFNYLAIFELGTINWTLSEDGQSLELRLSDGKVLAKYKLFDPLIIGRTWLATSYYDSAQDAMMDLIDGTDITLNVEVNERFDGTAGCNNYIGQYDDLTATSFTVTSVVGATRMLCGEQARLNTAPSIMTQEEIYLANFAKDRVIDWAILDNGTLELKDDGTGALLATYLESTEEPLPADETIQLASFSKDESGALNVGTVVAAVGTAAAALGVAFLI
jgi:heat shock protein HslJ